MNSSNMTATTRTNRWGFVASETSLCEELSLSTNYCADGATTLVVSSGKALEESRRIHRQRPGVDLIADHRPWSKETATPDHPLAFDDTIFGTAGWCEYVYPETDGVEVFSPTRFVSNTDFETLNAVFQASNTLPSNVITTIATDAHMLNPGNLPKFLDVVAKHQHRRTAFVFADKATPLATYARLAAIRELLRVHPRVWLPYLDPIVAADALAHGAEWVGIGASSARRLPKRPGDPGGRLAKGYLPGLFLRDLLELRSPAIYAEWFANAASPVCRPCGRVLDIFGNNPTDKAAIVRHNIHAMDEFLRDLMAQHPGDRATWLNQHRIDALQRHLDLALTGGDIKTERTLRSLLELDDTEMRSLSPAGIWS